jgi:hypothetical protein
MNSSENKPLFCGGIFIQYRIKITVSDFYANSSCHLSSSLPEINGILTPFTVLASAVLMADTINLDADYPFVNAFYRQIWYFQTG